jgi:tRNA modification GTPase
LRSDDTIAALSTADMPAARIILRLSGVKAHSIAVALSGASLPAGSASSVLLSFDGLSIPCWIYAFRAPSSYTGDDLVEFHLPGSPVLAKLLLDESFKRGTRAAEPGEFTARAYFNGKLDLTEAEGVAATIAAGNEAELRAARQLLAGELARRLASIVDSLAQTLALIEVGIDFSEEDVTFLAADEVGRRIGLADDALDSLVEQSNRFETLTREPRIVLAGRPNAGKSSLINALTGGTRAVVSDVAGTTRDVLTAPLQLPRGLVMLVDAAGVESGNRLVPGSSANLETGVGVDGPETQIAQQMQTRARSAIELADHLVLVRDVTDDRPPISLSRAPDLTVLTKSDLLAESNAVPGIVVSSRTNHGIDDLRKVLDLMAFGSLTTISTLALNRRHLACISDARAALERAAEKVHEDAAELVAAELRETLDHLGNIVGSVTADDVLGRVFSAFCIGK